MIEVVVVAWNEYICLIRYANIMPNLIFYRSVELVEQGDALSSRPEGLKQESLDI